MNTPKANRLEILLGCLFAAIALAVVLYLRLRLLGMPLERDEGEYAYTGQLLLKGFPPYLHAYTMKLPGMAFLSALFMFLFGQSVQTVHLGLLLVNILSALLVFMIARRLSGTVSGCFSAGLFLLLTQSQHLLGLFSHATHYVVFFTLGACLLLLTDKPAPSSLRYFLAGILSGLAFLVKQHAAFFTVAMLLFVLLERKGQRQGLKKTLLLLAGSAVPYLLTCLVMFKAGLLDRFVLWTISYASAYATGLTPLMGWINFKSQMTAILGSSALFWLLALAGLAAVVWQRRSAALLLPMLCAAFLAMTPGFHFRPHYFILLAPVIALCSGGLLAGSVRRGRLVVIGLFFAAALVQLFQERWFIFSAPPAEYVKKAYLTTKPFVEAKMVADYVRSVTGRDERILVLGSEPQIYFYADRLSATPHIYMYPLMEEQPYAQQMQEEMLRQIAESKPRYIILVDDLSSWLAVSKSGALYRERLGAIVMGRYELDGALAVQRERESYGVFGSRAAQFIPDTPSRILVYKLKGA